MSRFFSKFQANFLFRGPFLKRIWILYSPTSLDGSWFCRTVECWNSILNLTCTSSFETVYGKFWENWLDSFGILLWTITGTQTDCETNSQTHDTDTSWFNHSLDMFLIYSGNKMTQLKKNVLQYADWGRTPSPKHRQSKRNPTKKP